MSSTKGIPNPPTHLGRDGKALWRRVHNDFDLCEEHHIELLRRLCEQADRAAQIRDAIQKSGILITDRFGAKKPSPLLAEERSCANTQRLLIRELGLDAADASEARGHRDPLYRRR